MRTHEQRILELECQFERQSASISFLEIALGLAAVGELNEANVFAARERLMAKFLASSMSDHSIAGIEDTALAVALTLRRFESIKPANRSGEQNGEQNCVKGP